MRLALIISSAFIAAFAAFWWWTGDVFVATTLAIIVSVAVPATIRSAIALTLLAAWCFGMLLWCIGDTVPWWAQLVVDGMAMAGVLWFACRYSDFAVGVLFVPVLTAHILLGGSLLTDAQHWSVTWIFGNLQFLLAGYGSLHVCSWTEMGVLRRDFRDDLSRRWALSRFGVSI